MSRKKQKHIEVDDEVIEVPSWMGDHPELSKCRRGIVTFVGEQYVFVQLQGNTHPSMIPHAECWPTKET